MTAAKIHGRIQAPLRHRGAFRAGEEPPAPFDEALPGRHKGAAGDYRSGADSRDNSRPQRPLWRRSRKRARRFSMSAGKSRLPTLVKKAAQEINAPYVAARWLGGTISNWSEIKKRVDRLAELSEKAAAGTLAKQHTKLELVMIGREKKRLEERLDGITTLTKTSGRASRRRHQAREACGQRRRTMRAFPSSPL